MPELRYNLPAYGKLYLKTATAGKYLKIIKLK
jgi:hypothetical protein